MISSTLSQSDPGRTGAIGRLATVLRRQPAGAADLQQPVEAGRTAYDVVSAAKAARDVPNLTSKTDVGLQMYLQIIANYQVTIDRLWLSLGLAAVIIAALGYDNHRMRWSAPLRVMEVFQTSQGVAARELTARNYTPSENHLRSAIAQFVTWSLVIDPFATMANYENAGKLVRGKAVEQLQQLIKDDGAFRRLKDVPTLVRSIDPATMSVSLTKEGLAVVQVETVERSSGSQTVSQTWRFTLQYGVVPPQNEQEALSNPTGVAIVHLDRANVTKDRTPAK